MKNYKSKFLAKIFAMTILLFAFKDARAQQLISNGSFETSGVILYRQNVVWNQSTFASGWLPINTPDLFTDNATANDYWYNENGANLTCYPEVYALDNMFGQQNPRAHTMAADGNTWNHNYVMLFTSAEFIYQVLPTPLVAGDCYELSYWINRADVSGNAYCAQAVISSTNLSTLTLPANLPSDAIYLTTADQPTVGQQGYIVDKVNWTKVTFQFKAQGGEKYITIGDFDNYSQKIFFQGPTDCGSSNSCSSTCNAIIGSGTGYYYFYDDVSLVPISGSSFPNPVSFSNTAISTNYTGANLLLTGNITISGSRTWSNCQVRCNASTKIHIPTGSSLTLNNGTVLKAGCDLMWQGIIVEGSGKIVVTSSSIEDALTAITINGTGGWQIGGTSTANSYFKKNERDIVINGTSQYTNFIKSTVFDHSILLANPAQGIGGYGIEGVVINPQTSNTIITIGGSNAADVCQFKEGQYGIRSKDANVDVNRSLFTGIKQVAVDFQGTNPSGTLRKLNFISSSVVNSKRCIFSQHKTDLTVQYSSFAYATEHAIEWDDNHDGHLLIGDTTDALKGNNFQNNIWVSVVAWDNKTLQTDKTLNATNANDYTNIIISNNSITALPYTGGILIGEWVLGSNVTYHLMNVSKNTITGAAKGIQVYNVKGWSGAFALQQTFPIPSIAIKQNPISISTAVVPNPFGINAENAMGILYNSNLIGSNLPTNWQNNGIRLQNAEFSQVYNNGIEAGTGVSVGLDMLSSGIYCNILQNNVAGIVVGWGYLCPDVLHPHGSVTKAYSNSFLQDQPATVNIHDYYSPISGNNWVWDFTVAANSPKVWYSGIPSIPTNTTPNQSGFSLITSWTGAFNCPYDPSQMVTYSGTNVHAIMSDPNAQWRADYQYEVQRLCTGNGSATIVSNNIKSIIGIENNIGGGRYSDALTALGSLTASNTIEQNYIDVLTVIANLNYPLQRDPTSTEISTLTAIAEQFPRTGGAAVTLARTFLAVKYNLYFKDEMFTDGVAYGTSNITEPCSFSPAPNTSLGFMDAHGIDAGVTGTVDLDGSIAFDPYQLAHAIELNPDSTYRIYSKYGSKFTVVNKDFKTLGDWITQSPFNLSLSGVRVLMDTITTTEYLPIDTATSITDSEGNVYSVGTIASGSKINRMLLEKRSSKGALVWSQTYSGPVDGHDTATCITMDSDGFIYIAGKVWNGRGYDIQALKYDVDGYLQWSSRPTDPNSAYNYPYAIFVDENDMTVSVNSARHAGTTTNFRYVNWAQCLPSGDRIGHIEEEQVQPQFNAVNFYPNPSTGKLTVVFKNGMGGTLELFNTAGQLVFTQQLTQSGEVELPQNQVPDGLYLIKFTGEGQPQYNKLVIQRN
ncbi:MAG: T9SS type A sorting domain-containing protein [Bacteroidia bacterium]